MSNHSLIWTGEAPGGLGPEERAHHGWQVAAEPLQHSKGLHWRISTVIGTDFYLYSNSYVLLNEYPPMLVKLPRSMHAGPSSDHLPDHPLPTWS